MNSRWSVQVHRMCVQGVVFVLMVSRVSFEFSRLRRQQVTFLTHRREHTHSSHAVRLSNTQHQPQPFRASLILSGQLRCCACCFLDFNDHRIYLCCMYSSLRIALQREPGARTPERQLQTSIWYVHQHQQRKTGRMIEQCKPCLT
jgi:hypothetical protein